MGAPDGVSEGACVGSDVGETVGSAVGGHANTVVNRAFATIQAGAVIREGLEPKCTGCRDKYPL